MTTVSNAAAFTALLSVASLGASYYFMWQHNGWAAFGFWGISVLLEVIRKKAVGE